MEYLFKVPETKHGGVGLYQCKDGYVLKGANTTECKFGNWTRTTPRCVEVYCKFPGTIENGKVNTYSYTSDSNSSNKKLFGNFGHDLLHIFEFVLPYRYCWLETWVCTIIDRMLQK